MGRPRRTQSPEFKAKVALAALRGDQTLAEWTTPLAERAGWVGAQGMPPATGEAPRKAGPAKRGALPMERDGLARGRERSHGPNRQTGSAGRNRCRYFRRSSLSLDGSQPGVSLRRGGLGSVPRAARTAYSAGVTR